MRTLQAYLNPLTRLNNVN